MNRSAVVFEALYSYPRMWRRTLFKRDSTDVRFMRGTRFTGGGRELITDTTLRRRSLVMDELDASLHPVISGRLIEMFQKIHKPINLGGAAGMA